MEPPPPAHPLDDQQELIIFVQILGGIRFQQEKQGRKIALVASLNQQVFEAVSRRPVTPGSGNASFNAKLIWQCDRHFLKSMKTKNAPIKLDCYEVQPSGARCVVGSVVIPLRSVPVVTLPRIKSLKPRWYRLIGIENERWRRAKPELHLLVMVTDSQYLNQCTTARDDLSTPDVSEDEQTQRSEPKPERLPSNVELLADRGLLQVGCKETDLELFVFEIVLKYAQHLDQFCPGKDAFLLRYELFGDHHVARAERVKHGSAMFSIKAKIRINLRSSIAALSDYFEHGFKILVSVLFDDEQQMPGTGRSVTGKPIGTATVDFADFLKSNSLEEFKETHAANSHTLDAVRSVSFFATNATIAERCETKDKMEEKLIIPSMKYKLSLRYLGRDGAILTETTEKPTYGTASEEIDRPELDASKSAKTPETKQKSDEVLPKTGYSKPSTPQSTRTNCEEDKTNIDNILMVSEQDLRDIRRTFAFRVRVGTVKFTSSPSSGLWQLALQHPKADTPFTKIQLELLPDIAVHEDRIEFGDVSLELLFSALPDRVVDTISAEPSKLTLNGPHGSYALARLDNESLLVGTREKLPPGIVVMINEAGENVAIALISCALEEVGLNYNCQLGNVQDTTDCCHNAATAHGTTKKGFDETIAYKLVEEQKAWMREQRKQFIEQLKLKEDQHLLALAQRWKEQQAEAETRLSDRLAHVEALAAALEEANRKPEPITVLPQELSRVKLLEQQFRTQLEEIRAKAVRLERDAEAQIETTRRQSQELQQQQLKLSADQQYLVDSNRTLRNELEQERAARAQLELQLEEMSTSKQYYKEEWARLTRKVHQLQQELSVARTPYFQAPVKNKRTARPKSATTSSGSRMSVVRSGAHQGAGDACASVCHCSKDSDD
ncbi:centrosomal protein of 120 kDa-like [Anopheles stephensi]|uniref:centrosomal protein of 120 kDa-like n=1 Tax=Anopheles stephensi TaxID=30069 RepID=UPI001658BE67|nr:centrosomal protein of 120 kDa-like [Anopheles stephensi]